MIYRFREHKRNNLIKAVKKYESMTDNKVEIVGYPSGNLIGLTKNQFDALDNEGYINWTDYHDEMSPYPGYNDEDIDEIEKIINEKISITGFPSGKEIIINSTEFDILEKNKEIIFDKKHEEWRYFDNNLDNINTILRNIELGIIT